MVTNIILVIAIFFAIWFTIINTAKLILQNAIPSLNFLILAIAYTVIITHYIGIW